MKSSLKFSLFILTHGDPFNIPLAFTKKQMFKLQRKLTETSQGKCRGIPSCRYEDTVFHYNCKDFDLLVALRERPGDYQSQ